MKLRVKEAWGSYRIYHLVPGLEIRVFDKAIVYCVDIGLVAVTLFFIRPADIRTFTDLDFQSGGLCKRSIG